jgi:hypothetical protein
MNSQSNLSRSSLGHDLLPLQSEIKWFFQYSAQASVKRAMADLEKMFDPSWHTLLRNLLVQYVTLLTNPEGPAQSAPTLTRKEILELDITRKEASAASTATAAAANAGGGGGGGDSDGGGWKKRYCGWKKIHGYS